MKTKLLAIFLSFFIMNTFSQTEGFKAVTNSSPVLTKLKEASGKINTMQSSFSQEKKMSIFAETIKSKGMFYFKKSNMIRWEYTNPFKYLIIINNDKIYIKEDTKGIEMDMKSNKLLKEINNIMLGSVQGSIFTDTKNYTIKLYEDKSYYLVELSPLTSGIKDFIKTIFLYFDKKDNTISKLRLTEPSGDYTNISFSNKKMNITIPLDKFSFK